MKVSIDPAEFSDVIQAAVDAAVQGFDATRTTDAAGRIFLIKRQAAKALGVSEATVDRWRAEAGLPFVKIHGKVLFRLSALESWAATRESRGGEA